MVYVPFTTEDNDQTSEPIRDYPTGKKEYQLNIFPTELAFAEIAAGQESTAQTIILLNTGYNRVIIEDIDIVGPFSLIGSMPDEVPVGESVEINIKYVPSSEGASSGGLYINTGDAAGKEFVKLTGNASSAYIADLRTDIVKATNQGLGTANAIKAITEKPVPTANGKVLIAVNIVIANTGSATIAFNNDAPLTIKEVDGTDLEAADLSADIMILGYILNGTFRMLTDNTMAAAMALLSIESEAAQDARIASEAARDRSEDAANRSEDTEDRINEIVDSSSVYRWFDTKSQAEALTDSFPANSIIGIFNDESQHFGLTKYKVIDNELEGPKVIGTNQAIATRQITVGPDGNYETINDALIAASRIQTDYSLGGIKINIMLKSGFIMEEQIFVEQKDLSYVTILSEDAEVVIKRSALIWEPTDDSNWRPGVFPAFCGHRYAKLPVISALFNMDTSGTATGRTGIMVKEQSSVIIKEECGIKNVPFRGLYLDNGTAYARGTIWDGCGTGTTIADHGEPAAVRAANTSSLLIRDSSMDGIHTGLMCEGSYINAYNIEITDARTCITVTNCILHCTESKLEANGSGGTGHGINAVGASVVYADNIDFTNCYTGIVASQGSIVMARDSIFLDNQFVVSCQSGAMLNISNSVITNPVQASYPIVCQTGGHLIAQTCTILATAITNVVRCDSDGNIDLRASTLTGATNTQIQMGGTAGRINIRGAVTNAAAALRSNIYANQYTSLGFVENGSHEMSVDAGNADYSNTVNVSNRIVYFNTPITANRRCFGDTKEGGFRVLRTAAATGAFDVQININATIVASLAPGQWVDVHSSPATPNTWIVTARGTL